MDAIVQFVRNFLCCIKDLGLFSSTPLHDPSFTALFYKFPSPFMNKTTPLEVFIAISQLYAAISCSLSGIRLIYSEGVSKLMRLNRVAESFSKLGENLQKEQQDNASKKDKKGNRVTKTIARKIIAASLLMEANVALQNTFTGLSVFTIGVSFVWLFANSLHITEAGWIGGLPALIHALTAAELALLPLLYLMLKNASKTFQKSQKIEMMKNNYGEKKVKDLKITENVEKFFSYDNYTIIVNPVWKPFWTKPAMAQSSLDVMADDKVLEKECEKIEQDVDEKSKPEVILLDGNQVQELECTVRTLRMEGYRESLYFLFNFIAFYGYMLGILTYYFDEEKDQHYIVRQLKLGHSNKDAEWGGNFAGDLMWTIEPVVILMSPFVIKFYSNRLSAKKIKKD